MSKLFEKMTDLPIDIVNEFQEFMSQSKEVYDWAIWFLENQDVVHSFPGGKEVTVREHYLESLDTEEFDAIVKNMQKYVDEF